MLPSDKNETNKKLFAVVSNTVIDSFYIVIIGKLYFGGASTKFDWLILAHEDHLKI